MLKSYRYRLYPTEDQKKAFAQTFGSEVVYADRWFPSSKTCNHCGEVNAGLRLSDREWACPKCGCVLDRDYNAACNLRDYYYKVVINDSEIYTDGTAGIHACGDGTTTPGEPLGQALSLKQESSVGDPGAPTSSRWGVVHLTGGQGVWHGFG